MATFLQASDKVLKKPKKQAFKTTYWYNNERFKAYKSAASQTFIAAKSRGK